MPDHARIVIKRDLEVDFEENAQEFQKCLQVALNKVPERCRESAKLVFGRTSYESASMYLDYETTPLYKDEDLVTIYVNYYQDDAMTNGPHTSQSTLAFKDLKAFLEKELPDIRKEQATYNEEDITDSSLEAVYAVVSTGDRWCSVKITTWYDHHSILISPFKLWSPT